MIVRENLSDQLVNIIGNSIIQNELRSGDIIGETRIAKEWGVSRSPVRDALFVLEKQSLVKRTPKGGYTVLELTVQYIDDFYDTANMFYMYSFPSAAKNMSDKYSERLGTIVAQIEKSVNKGDYETYVNAVCKYAQTILQIAGNSIIEKISNNVMPAAKRILYAAIAISPSHLKDAYSSIQESFYYLQKGDPFQATKSFECFVNVSKTVLKLNKKKEILL